METEHEKKSESALKTWIVIFLLLGIVIFQGYLCFSVVGDQGQPQWDFGVIKDVPGESPYAVYSLENPQHVNGQDEESAMEGGPEKK